MSKEVKSYTYMDLPKHFYSGSILEQGPERFMVKIWPSRGDVMVEGYFPSQESAEKAVADLIAGVQSDETKRLYSASF